MSLWNSYDRHLKIKQTVLIVSYNDDNEIDNRSTINIESYTHDIVSYLILINFKFFIIYNYFSVLAQKNEILRNSCNIVFFYTTNKY